MLYRLAPQAPLEWTAFPARDLRELVNQKSLDLDELDWKPTEERVNSDDLLRIALRHGITTRQGLAVQARYTFNLGRADTLRTNQLAVDEDQAQQRAEHGGLIEHLMPGSTARGELLEDKIRDATDREAGEADLYLAAVLAAPANPRLVAH